MANTPASIATFLRGRRLPWLASPGTRARRPMPCSAGSRAQGTRYCPSTHMPRRSRAHGPTPALRPYPDNSTVS
jgi:hypothetical protein